MTGTIAGKQKKIVALQAKRAVFTNEIRQIRSGQGSLSKSQRERVRYLNAQQKALLRNIKSARRAESALLARQNRAVEVQGIKRNPSQSLGDVGVAAKASQRRDLERATVSPQWSSLSVPPPLSSKGVSSGSEYFVSVGGREVGVSQGVYDLSVRRAQEARANALVDTQFAGAYPDILVSYGLSQARSRSARRQDVLGSRGVSLVASARQRLSRGTRQPSASRLKTRGGFVGGTPGSSERGATAMAFGEYGAAGVLVVGRLLTSSERRRQSLASKRLSSSNPLQIGVDEYVAGVETGFLAGSLISPSISVARPRFNPISVQSDFLGVRGAAPRGFSSRRISARRGVVQPVFQRQSAGRIPVAASGRTRGGSGETQFTLTIQGGMPDLPFPQVTTDAIAASRAGRAAPIAASRLPGADLRSISSVGSQFGDLSVVRPSRQVTLRSYPFERVSVPQVGSGGRSLRIRGRKAQGSVVLQRPVPKLPSNPRINRRSFARSNRLSQPSSSFVSSLDVLGGVGIGLSFARDSELLSAPVNVLASDRGLRYRSVPQVGSGVGVGSRTGLDAAQSSSTRQSSATMLRQDTIFGSFSGFPTVPITPINPISPSPPTPRTPPVGGLPALPLWGPPSGERSRRQVGGRSFEYAPSLLAVFGDITGPEVPIITGQEVRPKKKRKTRRRKKK